MDDLAEFIDKYNQGYHLVTGREPEHEAWIWGHALGTVLSDWSEENYSCGWCEDVIQERLRQARRNVKYGGSVEAPIVPEDYVFAALYERAVCMVTLDDIDPMRYVPTAWDANAGI